MFRNIYLHLSAWARQKEKRKVLLIRGARQVGKTYAIRELGKNFKHFVEINFEEDKQTHAFFQDSLNPVTIAEKLSVYSGTPIRPGETLLFFDEIQSCPNALRSLRFFYEKMPELNVAAAGSLLEFALAALPSFGVGRIRSLFMYPLCFEEFLIAMGEEKLIDEIKNATATRPLLVPFHQKLINYLKIFQIIGGLPEVVASYLADKDIQQCFLLHDDIITTYRDDFAKYKKNASALRLNEVFSAVMQQAGSKFNYSRITANASTRPLKDALMLLIQAGLVYPIYHTAARGVPIGAQLNPKKFKLIPFDMGIYQRLSGLDLKTYMTSNDIDLINKGSLAEICAGLELIHSQPVTRKAELFYWHREARGSNAEIDYLLALGQQIIPLEVKAGTKGQMQSMHLFMRERECRAGWRVSLENYAQINGIKVLPLYALNIFLKILNK
ncbi:MAG: DUF4143 domain-containing protein [Calditrichaeota bacterium]|nr:MAG: DUF4143 domain-containing protein [Calditrichota bacterium]